MMFQKDLLRKKKKLCNKYKSLNKLMKHRFTPSRNLLAHSLIKYSDVMGDKTQSERNLGGSKSINRRHLRRTSKNEVLKNPIFNNLMHKSTENITPSNKISLKRLNVKSSLKRKSKRPHTSLDNAINNPKIMIFPQ